VDLLLDLAHGAMDSRLDSRLDSLLQMQWAMDSRRNLLLWIEESPCLRAMDSTLWTVEPALWVQDLHLGAMDSVLGMVDLALGRACSCGAFLP